MQHRATLLPAVLALFVLLSSAASGQTAVYLNFTAQHVDANSTQLLDSAGHLSDGLWLYGPTFGIYHDFWKAGPLHLGADVHGSILSHGGAKMNNGLAGFRGSVHAHVLPIVPYIQASAGVAGFNHGGNQDLNTVFQYELSGGVDATIFPHLDWKMVDVGGGGMTAGGHGNGSNGLFHISTGLALRF